MEVVFVQSEQKIFQLHSEYKPTGDQPQAIEALVKGFQEGNQFQTLLGVTGFRQDLYYGERDRTAEQADFGNRAQ